MEARKMEEDITSQVDEKNISIAVDGDLALEDTGAVKIHTLEGNTGAEARDKHQRGRWQSGTDTEHHH